MLIAQVSAFLICRLFMFPVCSMLCINRTLVSSWVLDINLSWAFPVSKSAEMCIDGISDLYMRIGNVAKWNLPRLPCIN